MASTLGGVILPDNLLWTDYHNKPARLYAMESNVDGEPVVWELARTSNKGRLVTLFAGEIDGNAYNAWFTATEKAAIEALVDAGGSLALAWDTGESTENYTVKFTAAPEWTGVYGYSDSPSDELYLTTLKLVVI